VNPSFDLDAPDHFTAGAVGRPGERVFYLQARQDGQIVTLKAEKEQVAALGEYLAGLIAKMAAESGEPAPAPAAADMDLLEPVEAAWAVGSIGVGYDEGRGRIIVVAGEDTGPEEDDGGETTEETAEERIAAAVAEAEGEGEDAAEETGPGGAEARFRITGEQAAAFVERAREVVRAGRPVCPLCSQPKDPAGHVCPRSNGHVAGHAV
jgi:uncharacterized repeat protein (TIGR03847 family)